MPAAHLVSHACCWLHNTLQRLPALKEAFGGAHRPLWRMLGHAFLGTPAACRQLALSGLFGHRSPTFFAF